jgi:hypothetical protein
MSKRAKQKKRKPEAKPPPKVDFAAGWTFWIVVFVLLLAPAWFWASRNAFSDKQSGAFPLIAAFVLAAIGAGFVSWVTNTGLQWWSRRTNRLARKRR